jgi:hypothetical protein
MHLAHRRLTLAVFTGAALVAFGSCSHAAESPKAEADEVLDLAKFPLADGAKAPGRRNLAALSYNAPGEVVKTFEAQKKLLTDRGWKELDGAFVNEQSASGMFTREGYTLSLTIFPASEAGTINVMLMHHGNIDLTKVAVPPGAKLFYGGPASTMYVTEAPVDATAKAVRSLLLAGGWQPYGQAADVQWFKKNNVRLLANVTSAPAQGGKTMISYSSELLSYDLPAPVETIGLQYTDQTAQLMFDTDQPKGEIAKFYQTELAKAQWKSTLDKLTEIDKKDMMFFRDPKKDMITLEVYEVDGKNRVIVKFQTAEELAELERAIKAEAERQKMAANKPKPQMAAPALPAGASDVEREKGRLQFKLPGGKALAAVEAWRKHFAADGWKDSVTSLDQLGGAVTFEKGDWSLSLFYIDPGPIPGEITLTAHGVEFAGAAGDK